MTETEFKLQYLLILEFSKKRKLAILLDIRYKIQNKLIICIFGIIKFRLKMEVISSHQYHLRQRFQQKTAYAKQIFLVVLVDLRPEC